jgi:hypothetical protein
MVTQATSSRAFVHHHLRTISSIVIGVLDTKSCSFDTKNNVVYSQVEAVVVGAETYGHFPTVTGKMATSQ